MGKTPEGEGTPCYAPDPRASIRAVSEQDFKAPQRRRDEDFWSNYRRRADRTGHAHDRYSGGTG